MRQYLLKPMGHRRPALDAGIIIKKDLREAVFKCQNCGLVIERQKNASRNIWNEFLRMWGFMGSPRKELSSMSPPMNPEEEESGEAQELSMGSIRIHT